MRKTVALIMLFAAAFAAVYIPADTVEKADAGVGSAEASDAWADPLKEISPNAAVLRRTQFSACGHVCSVSDPGGIVGLTRGELEARYPEWHIELFSERFVVLTRMAEGYCPDHFLLFLEGNTLRVARTAEPDFKLLTVLRQDVSPYEFDESTADELRSGKAFDTLKSLEDFISEHQRNADR